MACSFLYSPYLYPNIAHIINVMATGTQKYAHVKLSSKKTYLYTKKDNMDGKMPAIILNANLIF